MLQKTMIIFSPPYSTLVLHQITFRLHKFYKQHSFQSNTLVDQLFDICLILEHVLLLVGGRHILQIALFREIFRSISFTKHI